MDEVAAVLGRHFAAAGEADRAAHYLELAGDHAARIFANDEAIDLYRQVLAIIDGDGKAAGAGGRAPRHTQMATAVPVCERLAALLMLVDRFGEARAAALDGLARTPVGGPAAGGTATAPAGAGSSVKTAGRMPPWTLSARPRN